MDWFDIIQSIISGVVVGLVVFGLDYLRARRERMLADYRIVSNWEASKPNVSMRNFQLSKTNLSGYNLSNANLENADLSKAELWSTDLNKANLRDANFSGAYLVGTSLKDAAIYRANFINSTLRKERYPDTNFHVNLQTDFSESILFGSDFRRAKIQDVLFRKTNLFRLTEISLQFGV